MPYRFLEDLVTADVAFEAWGGTKEEMFISSAAALLATMVHDPQLVKPLLEQPIAVSHEELDLLLYAFLAELVFYKDARRLLLHADRLQITERDGSFQLEAVARGEEIDYDRHPLLVDVKAVTLHRFGVAFDGTIWKATVVLDI
ncbi:archease [Geobacter sp. SVR]|uniref:archease n=1 Tax=Geobacter sp. SVR TaxID=2495594 RepID=UPI00143F00DB|nr:archease [Geobacter sp. SVR]BCS53963.1 protein archease [Geobacter sp. SVR]GCF86256.1 protein archease [Geobacter sp. SVR]